MQDVNNSNPLKKAVLITGASGGLGSAIVDMLIRQEFVDMVVATDIDRSIEEKFKENDKAMFFYMDVGSEMSIQSVKQQLDKKRMIVKYIVNNAGVGPYFPVSESTEKLLDKVVKVNLYGQILTVSVFLEHLVKSKGRVVQISSDSVRLPLPFYSYPASKIAMEAFSVSMRRELKLLDIHLTIIRPGAIKTNFINKMDIIKEASDTSFFSKTMNRFLVLARKNVGKVSDPIQVARLVLNALTSKKPKKYYSINKNKKISLFFLLPGNLREKVITSSLNS